jgi:hypothetical protein
MSRNANDERLALLRLNLANELKSDNPGLLYIEDLKLSINQLEQSMKQPQYQMVT